MRTCLLLKILLAGALIETKALAQSISVEVNVSGQANIWLSGTPPGTHAGACIDGIADMAPGQSPVQVLGIPIKPDGRLAFSASGEVSNGPLTSAPVSPPDGLDGVILRNANGVENGIASITAPIDSLVGVFLGDDQSDATPSPDSLDFSSPQSRDFLILSPVLKQPFFIGDGIGSNGASQLVTVPKAATRLFLGTMDGCGHRNNEGVFHVRVSIADPPTLTPFRAADGVISLEAGDATLVPPMAFIPGAAIPHRSGIESSQVGAGEAQFTISVPDAGDYRIWGHVLARTSGQDSFFVSIDDGLEDVYDLAEGTWSEEWQWTLLNGRAGTVVPLTLNPRIFSLSAGVHTIHFRGRELGSRLDRISVTPNSNFVPVQHLIDLASPGETVTIPTGLFFDTLVIDKDLVVNGAGPTNTLVDAASLGFSLIVRSNRSVVLRGMTFQGAGWREYPGEGMGVVYSQGILTLIDCRVLGPAAAPAVGRGGLGIFSSGHLTLEGCEVRGHANESGVGNGIYCVSLQMSHSIVSFNNSDRSGSGIFCSGPAVITDSVIARNSGGDGAIYLQGSTNRSQIIRCEIRSNSSRFSPPGIYNLGVLELRDSLIRDHASYWEASFVNYGTARVDNCTFTGNYASDWYSTLAAGIHNFGDMALNHSTIVSNRIYVNHPESLTRSAGLLNSGRVRIKNSLIAWNQITSDLADNIPACPDVSSSFTTGGHNLIQNPGICGAVGDLNGDIYGQNPLIGPLADNGGPTLTHPLLSGSPAINAGVDSDVTSDQRGLPRSRPDIGAYEVLERPIPVLLPLPTARASTFEAVLVGDPRATYIIQHKDIIDGAEWHDSGEPVTTDGGGFVNVSVATTTGSASTFIRAVKR